METPISKEIIVTPQNPLLLLAVADGMGGHNKGEAASKIVLETVRKISSEITDGKEIETILIEAHREVVQFGLKDPSAYGLGSTIAGLCLNWNEEAVHTGWAYNVGDSRIYRESGNFLQQLSEDHTVVRELIDEGLISEEQARNHPQAGRLTESLGGIMDLNRRIKANIRQLKVKPKDFFLLCSDGLTDALDIDTLENIMNEDFSDNNKVINLFRQAMGAGGQDNISIIIVRC